MADLVRGRKLACSSLAKPEQPNFFHNVTGLLNPFTVPVNIPTTRETQVNLLVGKTEGIFNVDPTHAHELMYYQIELSVCFCQVWWHSPVIMATGETETGGLQDEEQHGKHLRRSRKQTEKSREREARRKGKTRDEFLEPPGDA